MGRNVRRSSADDGTTPQCRTTPRSGHARDLGPQRRNTSAAKARITEAGREALGAENCVPVPTFGPRMVCARVAELSAPTRGRTGESIGRMGRASGNSYFRRVTRSPSAPPRLSRCKSRATGRRPTHACVFCLSINTCLPHAPPAGHWSSLALDRLARANGFLGAEGRLRPPKREQNGLHANSEVSNNRAN